MSPGQIIVVATPVFLLLIALEFAWGCKSKRNTYRLNDAINSMSLGMLSESAKVFTRLLRVGIYGAVYTTVSLVPVEQARAFWSTWSGWLLALVFPSCCTASSSQSRSGSRSSTLRIRAGEARTWHSTACSWPDSLCPSWATAL